MAVKIPTKLHTMSPTFQKAWYKRNKMELPAHLTGSVKQASKEVKPSERAKALQAKSLKAYGATKGLKVGGEHGSGEMKDTIAPLTRDQHSKVQAAARAAKAAEKTAAPKREPIKSKEDRLNFLKKTFSKSKSEKRQARFDIPTVDPDNEGHDDLRDVHQSLHIRKGTYSEATDRMALIKQMAAKNKMNKPVALTKKPETVKKSIATHKHYAFFSDLDYADKDKKQGSNRFEEVEMNEASKAEAEKLLGGPVKTRTGTEPKGKLPLGFRQARNLARKAMKTGKTVTESTIEVNEMSSHGKALAKAIMAKQSKHPIAQQMGEAVKDQADVGEYDYEGDMAKSQLRSIMANSKRMHDMLEDTTNLPEWVQSKITLAEDYILTAANYMEGEMNEEVEQIYEGKAHDRITAGLKDENKNVRVDAILHPKATPEHISIALKDEHPHVREAAIRHRNATPEHISAALKDDHMSVRKAAIKNRNASSENISAALKDGDIYTRMNAIKHRNVKPEHIAIALKDKESYVRDAAKNRMKKEEVFTEEESIEEAKQVDHAKTVANSLAATHPNFRVSSYNGDHGRAHVVHHKSDTRNFKNGEQLMGPNIQLQHNHKTNKVHMEMQGDYDNVPDRDEETHHPDKAHEAAHKMFKPAIDLIHKTDKKTTNEEVEQMDEGIILEGNLSIRALYNKYADHYTSSEGNSAKRADAVEKTITKVHGPEVMNHLKKAVKANLRNDMDQEENHFERARNAAEKSGSDRVNATVGKNRSKFRKEEVELDESHGAEKLGDMLESDADHETKMKRIKIAPTAHLKYLHKYNMGYSGGGDHPMIKHIKDELKNRKMKNEEVEQMDEAVRGYIQSEPGNEDGTAVRRPADQAERDQLARNLIANRKYNLGKKIGKKSGSVRSNAAGMTPSQKISTALRSPEASKKLGPKEFPYMPKNAKITPFLSKEDVELEEGKIAKALAVGALSLASMGAKAHSDTTKSVADLARERPAVASLLNKIGAQGQVPASDKRAAELQRKQDQEMPASERRAKELKKEEVEQVSEKAPPGAKYERMVKHIKSGYAKGGLTPKEKSIAYATAWKAYKKNEEVEQVEEKYENNPLIPPRPNKAVGLKPSQLAKKPAMAAEAAEGSTPTTPKEKELAAHHGDKNKITYGDVIKARLKSVAQKAMKAGK